MFAVMVSVTTVSGALAVWSLCGFFLAALLVGSLTAPAHVRKLASAMAVAVVIAGGLAAVPNIIILCPPWWIFCP